MPNSTEYETSSNSDDFDATIVENPTKKRKGRLNTMNINSNSNEMLKALQLMEERLCNKIDSFYTSLDNKIDGVKSELMEQMAAISASVDAKLERKASVTDVDNLRKDVRLLQTQQNSTEATLDRIERESLLNRLIVSGIPYTNQEDPKSIINKIITTIGCREMRFNVYRAKPRNSNVTAFSPNNHLTPSSLASSSTGNVAATNDSRNNFVLPKVAAPTMILRFESTDERYEFYHHYLKFKALNLTHIGFNTPQRIFVNELLTKRNTAILLLVRKLKYSGKISKYYTSRGIIFITRTTDDEPNNTAIYDLTMLSNLDD